MHVPASRRMGRAGTACPSALGCFGAIGTPRQLDLNVHAASRRSSADRSDVDDQGSTIAIRVVHLLDLGRELEDLIADRRVILDSADTFDDQGATCTTVPIEERELRIRRQRTV